LPESLLELPDPGGECLLVGVVLLLALSLNTSQTRMYTVKKLSLAGNNLIIHGQGEFGDGKIGKLLFQCIPYGPIYFLSTSQSYCPTVCTMYILFQTDTC
jgi:hypothetical protein